MYDAGVRAQVPTVGVRPEASGLGAPVNPADVVSAPPTPPYETTTPPPLVSVAPATTPPPLQPVATGAGATAASNLDPPSSTATTGTAAVAGATDAATDAAVTATSTDPPATGKECNIGKIRKDLLTEDNANIIECPPGQECRSAEARAQRFAALGQKGCTLWFTGLSGSGKSTIAEAVEHRLIHGTRPQVSKYAHRKM